MAGTWMSVDAVMDVLTRDLVYYRKSGGGVTFCGGEPTMQHGFLSSCLKACKKAGIHTAVDTCGQVNWKVLKELLPYVNLFLYDLKHMDSVRHRELTGVGNELILANLQRINERGKPVWARVPLIPGYNDSSTNLKQLSAFVASLDSVERISLLPYNVVSGAKYQSIGKTYPLDHVVAHTRDEEKELAKMMSCSGKAVEIGTLAQRI
jgi:pyruvate formate lyase activating enzyme|tara:strand:- start:452 stop:1072 length:621 start_codon:yes stop_codon:yes gene_type:complete